jgi:hypothetical protein
VGQPLAAFRLFGNATEIVADKNFEDLAKESPSPGGEGRDEGEQ